MIRRVFQAHGLDLRLTSGSEGKHRTKSLHFVGLAADIGLPGHPEAVLPELRERLGEDYDVVAEGNHWHIEFQPKRGLNLPA